MSINFTANRSDNNDKDNLTNWISTGTLSNLAAEFYDFNWETDGWTTADNRPALKISNGAKLVIPHSIFK
jgi:hypothetical protein